MPTTASAPSTLPSGCAPTSSATPPKPTTTPSSRRPVTRTSWKKPNATRATKIGTAAWRIDARPESIRVSPHESSQKGIAVLRSATTTSRPAFARSSAAVSRAPTASGATNASVTAASPRRPTISVDGASSRTATLMNRNDAPQTSASASSITRYRRPTLNIQRGEAAVCFSTPRGPSPGPVTLNHLTQVAEQPLHRALGLTDREADRIQELLGREPNHFELAVFSLLWSEHCGYKHSAPLLKRLPSTGERVLQGPGENAGVLDLGEGLAVAFKVESHNHPSAVEPFQGAATGVGGILRDIVAMGARPIALLDGLWFGAPDQQFDRAVAGIGHYGNSTGIPTVGGAAVFDEAYRGNCLVNAMCVGLLESARLRSAKAQGPGNLVVLYGATTGRDGIGGASVLASQELGEDDADKRPSVQVGDPFTGKKLIEASVELVESGLVESLQDCGAAGLASAIAEMASDGAGIDVHLDRVPQREEGMEPWEIMISESQERMVAVVRVQMLDAARAVCEKWELPFTVIGEVTESEHLRAFVDGDVVGDIPARLLTNECPRYELRVAPRDPQPASPPWGPTHDQALLELLRSPNVRSKRWVYERYDQLVGSRTVRRSEEHTSELQ